jgi:hypothetical protein
MTQFIEYALAALAALLIVAWQGAALGASLDGPAGQAVSVTAKYHLPQPSLGAARTRSTAP